MRYQWPRLVAASWLAFVLVALGWPAAIAADPPVADDEEGVAAPAESADESPEALPSDDSTDDAVGEGDEDSSQSPDQADEESGDEPAEAENMTAEGASDDADSANEAEDANSDDDQPADNDSDRAKSPPPQRIRAPRGAVESSPGGTLGAGVLGRILPGKTTTVQLHSEWGSPKKTEKLARGSCETFDVAPFDRVRVLIYKGVVESVALQLREPVPVAMLAKRLGIDDVEPVELFDEHGELLGLAYPERGLLCGLDADSDPPLATRAVIEPIGPQPFLARAESRLPRRYADCLSDVKRAIELDPDLAQAHCLLAQVTLAQGDLEKALRAARHAVQLDPKSPPLRLLLARVLAEGGDHEEAMQIAREVIDSAPRDSLAAAQAYYQWGQCLAASAEHDYAGALKHHQHAIQLARPLAESANIIDKLAAQELLVDAHLAVAHDVGWGRWQQKTQAVPKWIEHALAHAGAMVGDSDEPSELTLRVYEGAMAAIAGMAKPVDASRWVREIEPLGEKMLAASNDPDYRAHVEWHLGVALADAAEIEAASGHIDSAATLGKAAATHLERGRKAGGQLPGHDYQLGRLYYRLGVMSAVDKGNHKQAAKWYDLAVPLLESPVPASIVDEGKLGETFVSMAVSYWDVNNRREALRLTSQGAELMESAAREGLLSQKALAVPYNNLASMYEQLGNLKEAKKFAAMAGRQQRAAAAQ